MYYLAGCENGLESIVTIIKFVFKIIQYVVPIALILLGTIDLVKAVIASKEDEIKKARNTLITRVITAVIVFLVPLIVSTLMGLVGQTDWRTCWNSVSTNNISNLFNGNVK